MTTVAAQHNVSSQFFKTFGKVRDEEQSVNLMWQNINYSVLEKDPERSTKFHTEYKEKNIVVNASGYAESGQLLAVLGPSGSGKTSLLNILAARCPDAQNSRAKLTGSIQVNGQVRNEVDFRKLSAYVLQDDNLYPHLTVMETFLLAVNFFLPAASTIHDRNNLVDAVIAELGLGKARDTIIGNEKVRGISGGERKRASIGVQLITDPSVLFLDEPTTGLDSFQAFSVMESMKSMASNNRLVISVLHQPRSSIFAMFDQLLLISEARTIYFGNCHDAVSYFSQCRYRCPETFNPSDYFLDILSIDNRNHEDEIESVKRVAFLANCWADTLAQQPERTVVKRTSVSKMEALVLGGNRDASWVQIVSKKLRVFLLLAWRAWTEQSRDVFTNGIKIFFTLFFSLIIAGIYSDLGNSQKSIQNRNGMLYFIIINLGFGAVNGVVNTFPKEKRIVNRERSGHAYDTVTYFLAKVFVEIPFVSYTCVLYACIVYFATGLNREGHRFGYFVLILMLTNLTAMSMGLVVSAMMPTVEGANAVVLPMMIIAILFGGFYIDIHSLPIVANWVPYFSYIRWSFEALTINEYKGLHFSCAGLPPSASCLSSGEMVLESLSFDGHTASYPVFGLAMVLLGFLAVALFFLENNKLRFTPLGHWGREHKLFKEKHPGKATAAHIAAADLLSDENEVEDGLGGASPASTNGEKKTGEENGILGSTTSAKILPAPAVPAAPLEITTQDATNDMV